MALLLPSGCANKTPPPQSPASCGVKASCNQGIREALRQGGIRPGSIDCRTLVRWEPDLQRHAERIVEGIAAIWGTEPTPKQRGKALHHALGYLVRSYFDQVKPQNLGVTLLKGHSYVDGQGKRRPLLLFRSGVLGRCDCFESLLRNGGVKHVVNLYGGSFPFKDLLATEKQLARELGVTYIDAAVQPELKFRRLVEEPEDYEANRGKAERNLAKLIRNYLLQPGGKSPRGNLHIHCGGGMHRSGMLFGVIQRCINGLPMDKVEQEYRRHTGYISAEQPGGYEPLNVRFIKEFDCSLLELGDKPQANK